MPEPVPPKTRGRTTVIVPRRGWFDVDPGELWRYRYLVRLFVYRDFVVYYKQTILGPLWWLIQPLFTTGMFTLIFAVVAKVSTDSLPAPLFYLAGVIVWTYFSECLQNTSRSFLDNQQVFGKVYFPRLVVPVSVVLSNLMKFAIQFGLFAVIYAVYVVRGAPICPTSLLWALPLLIVYLAALGFGVGILIASLTTRYRDLALALPFLAQLWMYASAVVYPLSQVAPAWRFWFALNPMVPAVECFRSMTLGSGTVSPAAILGGMGTTTLFLLLGTLMFTRIERTFADTI